MARKIQSADTRLSLVGAHTTRAQVLGFAGGEHPYSSDEMRVDERRTLEAEATEAYIC